MRFNYCFCDLVTFVCVLLLSDINECDNNTCMNGATCVDGINGYNCTCAVGYSGDMCDTGRLKYASNASLYTMSSLKSSVFIKIPNNSLPDSFLLNKVCMINNLLCIFRYFISHVPIA